MDILAILLYIQMTLAVFASPAHVASADTKPYNRDMKDFAPVIERWAFEARELTTAAVAKPSLACSDEMVEMALRGFSIADDLDGMYGSAPKLLAPSHVKVAREARVMASAAERACDDAASAASQTADSYADFAGPIKRIRSYVSRAGRIGR